MTELPDEAIEAFFVGDAHDAWEQDDALAGLVDHVLIGATGPAPKPSPALRAFLGDPAGSAPAAEATRPLAAVPDGQPDIVAAGPAPSERGTNVVPLFRRLRLTAGIAAAAGVAAAALAVVGTTGVLPEPVMQAVSWAVEAVTPFELHEPARSVTGGEPAPRRGPTSTVRPGPFGPVVGPGAVGQGGAPGQPAVTAPAAGQGGAPGRPAFSTPASPPASIPAGVPGAVRPPATSVDPGPPTSARPPTPVPAPAVSTPAGGASTPSTTPPTSVDRARQAPVSSTVPSTVAGAPALRP